MVAQGVPSQSKHIFCSYARKDRATVDRLVAELEAAGYLIWVDRSNMLGGFSWKAQLVQAIQNSAAILIVLSKHSVKSESVQKELQQAAHRKLPIVPIRIDSAEPSEAMQFDLGDLDEVTIGGGEFDAGLAKLQLSLEALSIKTGPSERPPEKPRWWSQPPGQFAVAGLLAPFGVWIAAFFGTPDALEGLQLESSAQPGLVGLGTVGILLLAGLLAKLLRSWLGRNPPLLGLAIYLLVMVPAVILLGHVLAAALSAGLAGIVTAWRGAGSSFVRPGLAAVQVLALAAAPALGTAAERIDLNGDWSPDRVIAVSSFTKLAQENPDELLHFSKAFKEKLVQLFATTGVEIQPPDFELNTLDDWNKHKFKGTLESLSLEPALSVGNSLRRCSRDAQSQYLWLSWLNPLPKKVLVAGNDAGLMSLVAVFDLMRKTREHEPIQLEKAQQNQITRDIAQQFYELELARDAPLERRGEWEELLEADPIDEERMALLVEPYLPESPDCPEPGQIRAAMIENIRSLTR